MTLDEFHAKVVEGTQAKKSSVLLIAKLFAWVRWKHHDWFEKQMR